MNEALWYPSDKRLASTRLTDWQQWVVREYGIKAENYQQWHQWSVESREQFWDSIARYFDVKFHQQPSALLGRDEMPGAEWFPGATLNFAEHLLRHRSEKAALVSCLENGERREMSFNQL